MMKSVDSVDSGISVGAIKTHVKKRLFKLGDYSLKVPELDGISLPKNISVLPLDNLMELWHKIVAAKAFIDQEMGKAEASTIIRKRLRGRTLVKDPNEIVDEAYLARVKGLNDSLETLMMGLNRTITVRIKELDENKYDRQSKRY